MAKDLSAAEFIKKLQALRSAAQQAQYQRAFTQSAADNAFVGVRMGQVFALAKEYMAMPLDQVEKLLDSPLHEARVGAVSIMDFQARDKKTPEARRKELYQLYLRRHDRINNWDLVDRSAPYVVGGYLFDKSRQVLYKLARSKNIWERRTAMVSTGYFIRKGDTADTFKIAELLLNDREDLIHKAIGWMLRAAGGPELGRFLDQHAAAMPRTALRYAVEHLDPKKREHYLGLKQAPAAKPKAKPAPATGKADSVDEFLARLPADQRQALQNLREQLLAAIPGAEETISYQVPMFKYKGRGLLSISARPSHCSLHLMSPPLAKALGDKLRGHKLAGVTIHFTPDKPLPAALVKQIVRARIKEVDAAYAKK